MRKDGDQRRQRHAHLDVEQPAHEKDRDHEGRVDAVKLVINARNIEDAAKVDAEKHHHRDEERLHAVGLRQSGHVSNHRRITAG